MYYDKVYAYNNFYIIDACDYYKYFYCRRRCAVIVTGKRVHNNILLQVDKLVDHSRFRRLRVTSKSPTRVCLLKFTNNSKEILIGFCRDVYIFKNSELYNV